jgi:hypothetical protein
MNFPVQTVNMPEPMPPARTRKYPFHEMVPGTMFFVPGPTPKPNTVMSLASATGKRLGFTFMTRQCFMAWDKKANEWVNCDPEAKGATRGVAVFRTA